MSKKDLKTEEEKLTPEERQVVDFFKGLIPILLEVKDDLGMELSPEAEKLRKQLITPNL